MSFKHETRGPEERPSEKGNILIQIFAGVTMLIIGFALMLTVFAGI